MFRVLQKCGNAIVNVWWSQYVTYKCGHALFINTTGEKCYFAHAHFTRFKLVHFFVQRQQP